MEAVGGREVAVKDRLTCRRGGGVLLGLSGTSMCLLGRIHVNVDHEDGRGRPIGTGMSIL